jgi:hypothetical protein
MSLNRQKSRHAVSHVSSRSQAIRKESEWHPAIPVLDVPPNLHPNGRPAASPDQTVPRAGVFDQVAQGLVGRAGGSPPKGRGRVRPQALVGVRRLSANRDETT